MKIFLQAQECSDTLHTTYEESTQEAWPTITNNYSNAMTELKKKDHKAKCSIQNSINDSIFDNTIGASTTHEAREILKFGYQGNDRVNTVIL